MTRLNAVGVNSHVDEMGCQAITPTPAPGRPFIGFLPAAAGIRVGLRGSVTSLTMTVMQTGY